MNYDSYLNMHQHRLGDGMVVRRAPRRAPRRKPAGRGIFSSIIGAISKPLLGMVANKAGDYINKRVGAGRKRRAPRKVGASYKLTGMGVKRAAPRRTPRRAPRGVGAIKITVVRRKRPVGAALKKKKIHRRPRFVL